MHENVIPCDKAGATPGEAYGGIHVGVVCLRKTLQVICLIFRSLDAAAEFVAPAEGERPSRKRRVKMTLVVTPFSPLATEKFGSLSVYLYHRPKRELSIERLAQFDVILTTYQIAGGDSPQHLTGGGESASKASCLFQ